MSYFGPYSEYCLMFDISSDLRAMSSSQANHRPSAATDKKKADESAAQPSTTAPQTTQTATTPASSENGQPADVLRRPSSAPPLVGAHGRDEQEEEADSGMLIQTHGRRADQARSRLADIHFRAVDENGRARGLKPKPWERLRDKLIPGRRPPKPSAGGGGGGHGGLQSIREDGGRDGGSFERASISPSQSDIEALDACFEGVGARSSGSVVFDDSQCSRAMSRQSSSYLASLSRQRANTAPNATDNNGNNNAARKMQHLPPPPEEEDDESVSITSSWDVVSAVSQNPRPNRLKERFTGMAEAARRGMPKLVGKLDKLRGRARHSRNTEEFGHYQLLEDEDEEEWQTSESRPRLRG